MLDVPRYQVVFNRRQSNFEKSDQILNYITVTRKGHLKCFFNASRSSYVGKNSSYTLNAFSRGCRRNTIKTINFGSKQVEIEEYLTVYHKYTHVEYRSAVPIATYRPH